MAIEIERKFLLINGQWRQHADAGTEICQGYLNEPQRSSVRVRIDGRHADLNIKSASLEVTRREYEYPIPLEDARQLLAQLCLTPHIHKTRYHVPWAGMVWEIDVFHGDNHGLEIAEVELQSSTETPQLPPWVGAEVSDDPRYYNPSLLKHPFKAWDKQC